MVDEGKKAGGEGSSDHILIRSPGQSKILLFLFPMRAEFMSGIIMIEM
jgi:hypothetical protein